jgi:cytochrome c-type biogenesis protein CcmH
MTLIQRIILAVLFIIPIFAIGFFLTQGDEEPFIVETPTNQQAGLPAVSNTDTMPSNHPDPQIQVRAMIKELEQKIAQNQHELKDILLLGRAYVMVKDYTNAATTYEKALVIEPNSIDVLLPLADILAVVDNGKLTGRSYELLEQVLKIDPNIPMALWLMGNAEMQLERPDKAAEYWTTLYYIFPEGSENRMKVGQQLEAIGKAPAEAAFQPFQPPAAKQTTPSNTNQAIHITLDISPETKEKLKGTTVFIYAKSQTGMPMPIAAKKFPGEQLTNSITITEADELMPNRKLKDIAQIKVGIKISTQSDVDNKAELFRVEQSLPDSRKVHLVVKF